jgi:hypothetical protein
MLCSACRHREAEVFGHWKLPLQPYLCRPCYSLERSGYWKREEMAKSLQSLIGKTFREATGLDPGDPSFWLKPLS